MEGTLREQIILRWMKERHEQISTASSNHSINSEAMNRPQSQPPSQFSKVKLFVDDITDLENPQV